jgi:peptide/nickel transport system permease protein
MLAYVIRRFLQSAIVLLIVMLFTFTLPYFQTGGILRARLRGPWNARQRSHRVRMGRPEWYGSPLRSALLELPRPGLWTLQLGTFVQAELSPCGTSFLCTCRAPSGWPLLSALIFTILIGIPLGIYQASRRNTVGDYTATGVAFVLYAMPLFLLCLLMLHVFSFQLATPAALSPFAGSRRGRSSPIRRVSFCRWLVSPWCRSLTLSRFMRGTVLEVLVQDYIRTAKAKGCSGVAGSLSSRHAQRPGSDHRDYSRARAARSFGRRADCRERL